jgi:hypothetical protein
MVAGRDAKIGWKALSHRIGHSDVAFTMKQYVQTDLEADHKVANTLAELIIGGALASLEVRIPRARLERSVNERDVYKVGLQTSCQRPSFCSKEGLWPW